MNPLAAVYRGSALFAEPLTRWFDTLGRDRVHVIVFDDFVRDAPAELRKVLEFAGRGDRLRARELRRAQPQPPPATRRSARDR